MSKPGDGLGFTPNQAGIAAAIVAFLVIVFSRLPLKIQTKIVGGLFMASGAMTFIAYRFGTDGGYDYIDGLLGLGLFTIGTLLTGIWKPFDGKASSKATKVDVAITDDPDGWDEWEAEQERKHKAGLSYVPYRKSKVAQSQLKVTQEPALIDVPEGLSGFGYMNYEAEVLAKRALEKK